MMIETNLESLSWFLDLNDASGLAVDDSRTHGVRRTQAHSRLHSFGVGVLQRLSFSIIISAGKGRVLEIMASSFVFKALNQHANSS